MSHVTHWCSPVFRFLVALLLCSGLGAVHADDRCPLGVYPDGHIYNADNEYALNTCTGEGTMCEEVYFYSQGGFSEARCVGNTWRRVERRQNTDAADAAPRCDYSNVPDGIDIVSTSAEVCAKSNYKCGPGSSAFSNQCGCGCMAVPGS